MTKRPDQPLRIVFYSPALPESGASNGIVTYTRVMRDALRGQGHEVIVVTTDEMEHANGTVVPITKPAPLRMKLRLKAEALRQSDGSDPWVRLHVLNALKASLKLRPDVIEMEESHGWAGRIAGAGVAVIARLHGPWAFGRDEVETDDQRATSDLREAAERASLGHVQAVTSPSGGLLRAMVDRYKLDLSLSRTIPNPMPSAAAQKAWDVQRSDPNQILSVGRFDLRKGADILMRAFAKACEQRPSLSLVMAGPDSGLTQPDGNAVKFEQFVSSEVAPGLRSRISFLGSQSQHQLTRLRRESGLAIATSRFESFSYSIAEAMSLGMPVLTSDNFGGCELVRDGVDGRIVPIGDVDATAEAILQMTVDPGRLAEMGRSAYLRASEFLSPERIARETVQLYREAMARLSTG